MTKNTKLGDFILRTVDQKFFFVASTCIGEHWRQAKMMFLFVLYCASIFGQVEIERQNWVELMSSSKNSGRAEVKQQSLNFSRVKVLLLTKIERNSFQGLLEYNFFSYPFWFELGCFTSRRLDRGSVTTVFMSQNWSVRKMCCNFRNVKRKKGSWKLLKFMKARSCKVFHPIQCIL